MDFAAGAVFDAIAPQPRSASARPAPSQDASEPSFDDHLDATETEPSQSEVRAKASDSEKEESAPPADSETPEAAASASDSVAPPAPPVEPPAPLHVIQIVAAPAPAAIEVASEVAPADALPTPTDSFGAPAPSFPSETPAESAGSAKALGDADAPAVKAEPSPKSDDSQASAQIEPADPLTPKANTADAAIQAATAQTESAPALPASEAPPLLASAIAQPAPVERQALSPQRPGKSDSNRSAKEIDAAHHVSAAEAPPPTPQFSKSAPSPSASKESVTPAPMQIDAPKIHAPAAQQGATPLTQAAAQTQQTSSVDHSNAMRAAPAAAQVAREIVRRFEGENTRFELRLDPPELGRVEVRLDVSRDNRVTAVISADNPQALTELARHARELEQMLNASGLELTDNGLSFDLRQGSEDAADAESGRSNARAAAADDATLEQQTITARPLGFERWRGVRVDVMV